VKPKKGKKKKREKPKGKRKGGKSFLVPSAGGEKKKGKKVAFPAFPIGDEKKRKKRGETGLLFFLQGAGGERRKKGRGGERKFHHLWVSGAKPREKEKKGPIIRTCLKRKRVLAFFPKPAPPQTQASKPLPPSTRGDRKERKWDMVEISSFTKKDLLAQEKKKRRKGGWGVGICPSTTITWQWSRIRGKKKKRGEEEIRTISFHPPGDKNGGGKGKKRKT